MQESGVSTYRHYIWKLLPIVPKYYVVMYLPRNSFCLDCYPVLGEVLGLLLHSRHVSYNDCHPRACNLRSFRYAFLPLTSSY